MNWDVSLGSCIIHVLLRWWNSVDNIWMMIHRMRLSFMGNNTNKFLHQGADYTFHTLLKPLARFQNHISFCWGTEFFALYFFPISGFLSFPCTQKKRLLLYTQSKGKPRQIYIGAQASRAAKSGTCVQTSPFQSWYQFCSLLILQTRFLWSYELLISIPNSYHYTSEMEVTGFQHLPAFLSYNNFSSLVFPILSNTHWAHLNSMPVTAACLQNTPPCVRKYKNCNWKPCINTLSCHKHESADGREIPKYSLLVCVMKCEKFFFQCIS